jgi:hypothetical protein
VQPQGHFNFDLREIRRLSLVFHEHQVQLSGTKSQ